MGKSRLTYEFTHSHRVQDWLILEASSVSYGKAASYLPVVDLLKGYFRIGDRDTRRDIREKVTGKILALDRALEMTLPALLALFDVSEDAQWQALDPSERRQRTLDAVKHLLLREARVQPVLVLFEDLHWIDSETQALLDSLVESLPSAPLLLLVNYRPEYAHRWGSKTSYAQIRLDPLPPSSARELLHDLLGDDSSTAPLASILINRTDGNPFFLEESVRILVETGTLVGERGAYRLARTVQTLQIPATAQAILAARIDRLSPEHKRLLQAASVIGKDVPLSLLHAVADEGEDLLRRALTELQATEFLYETRLFPDVEYTFKHALTHEVTYGTLLQDRRRALHARIVAAIEQLYGDRLGEQMELLAHHAVRGEAWEKAVVYLREAGNKAFRRSANADAVSYFTRGLEIVEMLPEGAERDRHDLALLLALGPAVQAVKGVGAPEAERVFSRARELSERVGETGAAFQALWGQWMVSAGQGRVAPARRIGGELLTLAERTNDRALLLEAHHAMWATSFLLGELSAAEQHIEQGISLYHREQHRSHAFLYGGHDPGVCCRVFSGLTAWLLGHPARAVESNHAALTLARELSHQFSLALALHWAAMVHQLRRDVEPTRELAESLVALCTDHGFQQWRAGGTILVGWAQAEQENGGAGIARLCQGIGEYRAMGTKLFVPYYLSLLAAAHLEHGDAAAGLAAAAEAVEVAAGTGERIWDAEIYRLKGELLLALDPVNESQAEIAFRQAIEIGRGQGARGWALRAVTRLSRLLRQQGKRDEARQMLAEIYVWFTEGFDTADLRDAKALLDALSASP